MQNAQTPFITGPQFQAKAEQVRKLLAQRKTHQAADFKAQAAKPGGQRESSAELDRLKAENASLRAKLVSAKPATLTAAAYLATVAKPRMSRAEFDRLSHPQRNEFIRSGGKLI